MASERDARRRAYLDKAAAEIDALAARGVRMGGNAFSSVLLVKGELSEAEKNDEPPFSGADGAALRASLERLGYPPEDWEWLLTVDADGAVLDAGLLRGAVCALDPATLVCCDEATSSTCSACASSTSADLPRRSATPTRSRSCGLASRGFRRWVSRSKRLPFPDGRGPRRAVS